MTFKQEYVKEFKQLFETRKEQIRNYEGCSHLELWQDQLHENVFYTYSLWHKEEHLEAYRLSELFQDTWTTVKQWFDEKPMAFSANQLIKLP